MTRTIRIADSLTESKVSRLADILIAVVDSGASVGYLPPGDAETAADYWRSVCQPGVVLFFAEIDGVLAGTVQLDLAMKANASHRAEVNRLLVDPAYQRRGIGRFLMGALEGEALARGRTLLHLDTREGDASNDFYRSLGWIEVETIPMLARSAAGTLDGTTSYYSVSPEP
ncbi:GNAT family N-acetyltransferase [soil metagenome]